MSHFFAEVTQSDETSEFVENTWKVNPLWKERARAATTLCSWPIECGCAVGLMEEKWLVWGVGDQVIGVICVACGGEAEMAGRGGHPEGAKGMAVLRAYAGWGLVFLASSGMFLRNRTSAESPTRAMLHC